LGQKMYKPGRIIVFLAVFLCIVLAPLSVNLGRSPLQVGSALDTPEINSLQNRECIEPTGYMRAEHMSLLDNWRKVGVRSVGLDYVNSAGIVFEISLENSCFSCHSNRFDFCSSCHDLVAITLNCQDCHSNGAGMMSMSGGR